MEVCMIEPVVVDFNKPCDEECRGKYSFPCVSGLCPFGMDFMTECYPYLEPEQKMLFDELFMLRAEVARKSLSLQVPLAMH
ncbi:hypothetical protein [Archaeoglobus veneficus]|uniref:Uncharacterized protein n=1 Tax=Archaeoglobus veneficus (strain DSM 11195 / SNP6) TaxID=693661 RepID=F2KSK6_ARCVS|nr:hypothetical protein [Archaeoglobus veneficus]AEA48076.1 hypothetical protein Arcve_2087 [Archaeoglobus veneficus SNP6]